MYVQCFSYSSCCSFYFVLFLPPLISLVLLHLTWFWILWSSYFSMNVLHFEKSLETGVPRPNHEFPDVSGTLQSYSELFFLLFFLSFYSFVFFLFLPFLFIVKTAYASLHLSALLLVPVILTQLRHRAETQLWIFLVPQDRIHQNEFIEASLWVFTVFSLYNIYSPFSCVKMVQVEDNLKK